MSEQNAINPIHWIWPGLLLLALVSCTGNSTVEESYREFANRTRVKRVVAVSYALQFLTKQIVGDSINVEWIGAPDARNDQWTPSAKQIASLQSSDLIIVNGPGAEYATWLARVSISDSKLCNTSENLSLRELISIKDYRIVHRHGPEGEHSHAYMVAFPWLDPSVALKQAEFIQKRLSDLYPDLAEQFRQNGNRLSEKLRELANQLTQVPVDQQVMSATPRFKYLTRAAGIQDVHLLWFELPAAADWESAYAQDFAERSAKAPAATAVLFGRDPGDWLTRQLESDQKTAVQLELLGTPPESGDYLSAMVENIKRLKQAIKRRK